MARRTPRSARPAKRAARASAAARPSARKKTAATRPTPATRPPKTPVAAKKKRAPAAGKKSKTAATKKATAPARRNVTRPAPAAKAAPKVRQAKAPGTAKPAKTAATPRPRRAPRAPAPAPVTPPAPPEVRATARRTPPPRPRPSTPPVVDLEPEDDDRPETLVPGAVSSLDMDHHPREVRRTGVDPEPLPRGRHLDDAHLVAGDVDASLEAASHVGEETPGGDNPTPDQDVVDLIGRSLGVEYDDDEELEGGAEITKRDRKRWELDPASSEDWKERSKG